jgi:hypothetical protein
VSGGTVSGLPCGPLLPGDEHYARNFIGGSWVFPAVPFEYEIRSPLDGSGPGLAALASEPTGPVLIILTWQNADEFRGVFAHPRYRDGPACTWGLDDADLRAAGLPHTVILREAPPLTAVASGTLPAAWTAGQPSRPAERRAVRKVGAGVAGMCESGVS